jgi:hypothetical protein
LFENALYASHAAVAHQPVIHFVHRAQSDSEGDDDYNRDDAE